MVDAEFVHCYTYSVMDLQIIMFITRQVILVYPIYPPLFAFQPENSLEVSCLLTLLVSVRGWGEHCFVYFGKPYERACTHTVCADRATRALSVPQKVILSLVPCLLPVCSGRYSAL